MLTKEQLIYNAKLEKARRNFYYYCKLMYPSFYKDNREYLKQLCDCLQDFYSNDNEYMLINLPPRHGKSFTATNFIEWVLGRNPLEKIISGSYNEDLSKTFSKKIRNTIETEKLDNRVIYSDIFPNTKIKYGSAEAKKWQTEKSNQINYLATSPTGSATGFGASMEVIDDLIKNSEEANNQNVLEKHWDWFTNTMLSRREGKKKVLIIMTRWSNKDLAGRVLKYIKEKGFSYSHINLKAYEDNKMLCDDIFNYQDYQNAMYIMGKDIFSANYQQEPIDLKGVLYSNLMTYEKLPKDYISIENYTDTADTGKDFLCSITYAVYKKQAYVIDVIYTQDSMEITEPLLSKTLLNNKVNICRIESNNGGRGFSRNVKRITQELGNRHTMFKPFTQTKNKEARILTNSTGVMQNIYFPKNWKLLYPEFYQDVTGYQRLGKNLHDDAPDTLTGVYEKLISGEGVTVFR